MQYVKKYTVGKWDIQKKELLSHIESFKKTNNEKYGYATFSDYWSSEKTDPSYKEFFNYMIHPYLMDYCRSWGCDKYVLNRVWFMEYSHEDSNMASHNHTNTNMCGVLQLVIEGDAKPTKLFGSDVELTEGDLVLFPSMLPHTSPLIKSGKKVVIGFDWTMWGVGSKENE